MKLSLAWILLASAGCIVACQSNRGPSEPAPSPTLAMTFASPESTLSSVPSPSPNATIHFVSRIILPDALFQALTPVPGPEDTMWVCNPGYGVIVAITRNGRVRYVDEGGGVGIGAPTGLGPWTMTSATDGSVWYSGRTQTDVQPAELVRVTRSGRSTTHKLPFRIADSLVPGLRGAVWFVADWNKLGKMTPLGSLNIFELPTHIDPRNFYEPIYGRADWYVSLLAAKKDGSVWLVQGISNVIFRVSDDGHAREYRIAGLPKPLATQLVVGPDGSIWFRTWHVPTQSTIVGFIRPDGKIRTFKVPASIWDLTVDRSGIAWGLTSAQTDPSPEEPSEYLVRITPSGSVSEFSTPAGQGIMQIFVAWEGELWVQVRDFSTNRTMIARVVDPR